MTLHHDGGKAEISLVHGSPPVSLVRRCCRPGGEEPMKVQGSASGLELLLVTHQITNQQHHKKNLKFEN